MKKIHDLVFIFLIILLISTQFLIQRFFFLDTKITLLALFIDLSFNILLGVCLVGLYIKKYTPDKFRIILVGIFLFELVIGIFIRKLMLPYGTAIMLIGLLGVLATWRYTHKNRLRFLQNNK